MKKKTLKLTIPSPCETSATEMFRALDGKFCKGCKRVVIDFKKMNDTQLLDYFTQHHGKICGEFRPEQIDREIIFHTPSTIDIFRQRTVAVAAITSLAIAIPATQINAQSTHEVTEQQVRGKIRMDSIPKENQPNAIESKNYVTQKMEISPNKSLQPSEIVPDTIPPVFLAGGIGVVMYEEQTQTIGDTIVSDKIPIERFDTLSVYPNPIFQSFRVTTDLAKKDTYELFLFNESGEIFWSETKKLRKGRNDLEIIITTPLPAGTYIFHIRSKEMQLSEILVKAE